MDTNLILPCEVDRLCRYPRGRSARLARQGKVPHLKLPDGEIRFLPAHVDQFLKPGEPERPALRLVARDIEAEFE